MAAPKQDALDLATGSMDAKAFPAYGGTDWAACAELLLSKTFSPSQADTILRSPFMERAAEENDGCATAAGLRRFLHRYAINPYNLSERLTREMGA